MLGAQPQGARCQTPCRPKSWPFQEFSGWLCLWHHWPPVPRKVKLAEDDMFQDRWGCWDGWEPRSSAWALILCYCYDMLWPYLVDGLEPWTFMTFHSVGNSDPNWRTHIFQRGRYTTNQLWLMTHMTICWICSDSSIPDGLIKVDHIKPPPPHALPTEIGDFRLAGQKPNEPREFAEFGGPKKMEQSSGGCCWWYAFCYIFHTTISGKCCGFVIHVGIVEILEGYSWSAHQCSGIFGAQAFERNPESEGAEAAVGHIFLPYRHT